MPEKRKSPMAFSAMDTLIIGIISSEKLSFAFQKKVRFPFSTFSSCLKRLSSKSSGWETLEPTVRDILFPVLTKHTDCMKLFPFNVLKILFINDICSVKGVFSFRRRQIPSGEVYHSVILFFASVSLPENTVSVLAIAS